MTNLASTDATDTRPLVLGIKAPELRGMLHRCHDGSEGHHDKEGGSSQNHHLGRKERVMGKWGSIGVHR